MLRIAIQKQQEDIQMKVTIKARAIRAVSNHAATGQTMLTATEKKPPSQALRLFCVIMTLRCELEDSSKPRPLPDHAAWILDVLS